MVVASHVGHRRGQPCTALCSMVLSVTGLDTSPDTLAVLQRGLDDAWAALDLRAHPPHGVRCDVEIPERPYERPCDACSKPFRVRPCAVRKAVKRGHNPPRFCSVACQHAAYLGAGNPKWRGGRVPQSSGYVYVYAPAHPHATAQGYVMEHRLVMEDLIGRYLEPEEEVHHKNLVRDDNRPENLELMASTFEHRARHADYQDEPCANDCGAMVSRSAGHRRRWDRAFCSRQCAALAGARAAIAAAKAVRML